MLEYALKYAKRGFKVFPLTPQTKIPLKGTKGSKEATTSIEQVKEWWTVTPHANIGLVTEKFLVLDIDVHDKEKDGYKSLETLENTFDKLPKTSTVKTANDGLHIYLLKPKGVQLPQKIAFMNGIDIKAHPNNYVVAPPSKIKRQDGSVGSYEVKESHPIVPSPQWLIDYILKDQSKQKAISFNSGQPNRYRNKTTDLLERLVTGVETGERNNMIAKTTGQLLAYGVTVPTSWALIQFMNHNSMDPLSNKELERTFESICRKELSRY